MFHHRQQQQITRKGRCGVMIVVAIMYGTKRGSDYTETAVGSRVCEQ